MLPLVLFPLRETGWTGDSAWSVRNHFNAEIHLEPGQAHHFFSLLHALRINFGIFRFGGVGIDANFVAKLAAAYHGIRRGVVNFSGDIPECHFNCAHSATLPRMPAELLDLAKKLIELQRVLAYDAAFQEKRVSRASTIAHFAQSINALVGVD